MTDQDQRLDAEQAVLEALESWWRNHSTSPTMGDLYLEVPGRYDSNTIERAIQSLRSQGLVEDFYPASLIVQPKRQTDAEITVSPTRSPRAMTPQRKSLLSKLMSERDSLMQRVFLLDETIAELKGAP